MSTPRYTRDGLTIFDNATPKDKGGIAIVTANKAQEVDRLIRKANAYEELRARLEREYRLNGNAATHELLTKYPKAE